MEKEELEKKIEKLEKENQELKALLDQHGIIWNRTLRKMSTLEKIRVFRSYFHDTFRNSLRAYLLQEEA